MNFLKQKRFNRVLRQIKNGREMSLGDIMQETGLDVNTAASEMATLLYHQEVKVKYSHVVDGEVLDVKERISDFDASTVNIFEDVVDTFYVE
jgi:hypothetical protein